MIGGLNVLFRAWNIITVLNLSKVKFSTLWKKFGLFFHTVENGGFIFPHCGKWMSRWTTHILAVGYAW